MTAVAHPVRVWNIEMWMVWDVSTFRGDRRRRPQSRKLGFNNSSEEKWNQDFAFVWTIIRHKLKLERRDNECRLQCLNRATLKYLRMIWFAAAAKGCRQRNPMSEKWAGPKAFPHILIKKYNFRAWDPIVWRL